MNYVFLWKADQLYHNPRHPLMGSPRPQAGASRARSGEQDASNGNIVLMVPLDPAP